MEVIENYIYVKKLNLDLFEMKLAIDQMYNFIKGRFVSDHSDYSGQSTMTTKLYSKYNLLMYPFPPFHDLYRNIQETFHELNGNDTSYNYIQCWLNYYREDEFIDWHGHWPSEMKTWHGFFCVDCEPSHTTYRLYNNEKDINVESKNNQLVISRSDGDQHRTWPWPYADRPRITIAFDIVSADFFMGPDKTNWVNHWIPI